MLNRFVILLSRLGVVVLMKNAINAAVVSLTQSRTLRGYGVTVFLDYKV